MLKVNERNVRGHQLAAKRYGLWGSGRFIWRWFGRSSLVRWRMIAATAKALRMFAVKRKPLYGSNVK